MFYEYDSSFIIYNFNYSVNKRTGKGPDQRSIYCKQQASVESTFLGYFWLSAAEGGAAMALVVGIAFGIVIGNPLGETTSTWSRGEVVGLLMA
jgi:hypothetical protein